MNTRRVILDNYFPGVFFETMEIAGAIAPVIFAVDTIFKGRVNVHTKCTGNTRF